MWAIRLTMRRTVVSGGDFVYAQAYDQWNQPWLQFGPDSTTAPTELVPTESAPTGRALIEDRILFYQCRAIRPTMRGTVVSVSHFVCSNIQLTESALTPFRTWPRVGPDGVSPPEFAPTELTYLVEWITKCLVLGVLPKTKMLKM